MESGPGDPSDPAATTAEDEYRRALRDYTQLMRHRLANPLTTIVSGIATLREMPDLDIETRSKLLEMMADHASELERVALYPVALKPEESDLVPMAASDGGDRRAQVRDRRKGMNEAQFRRINDLLAELSDEDFGDTVDFVCECSDNTCAVTVQLTIGEYEGVHSIGSRFVVAPSHNDDEIELVVERAVDWWTVEKYGIAREQAEFMHEGDSRDDPGSPPRADS